MRAFFRSHMKKLQYGELGLVKSIPASQIFIRINSFSGKWFILGF